MKKIFPYINEIGQEANLKGAMDINTLATEHEYCNIQGCGLCYHKLNLNIQASIDKINKENELRTSKT